MTTDQTLATTHADYRHVGFTLEYLSARFTRAGIDHWIEGDVLYVPAGIDTYRVALTGCALDPWRITYHRGADSTPTGDAWTGPTAAVLAYMRRNAHPARPTTRPPVAVAADAYAADPTPDRLADLTLLDQRARAAYLDSAPESVRVHATRHRKPRSARRETVTWAGIVAATVAATYGAATAAQNYLPWMSR